MADKARRERFKIACDENDIVTIDSILSDPQFDPNFYEHPGCIMTHKIIAQFKDRILKRVIRHPRFDPNFHIYTVGNALGTAISANNKKAVDLLLTHRLTDVNTTCSATTPLILAVMLENKEIMRRLLLEPGIKLEAVDSKGHTALFYAIQYGNVYAFKVLFGYGARLPEAPHFPTRNMRLEIMKEEWLKATAQPLRTRFEYCKEFGIPDPEEDVAAVFALVVFFCDDFLAFKSPS